MTNWLTKEHILPIQGEYDADTGCALMKVEPILEFGNLLSRVWRKDAPDRPSGKLLLIDPPTNGESLTMKALKYDFENGICLISLTAPEELHAEIETFLKEHTVENYRIAFGKDYKVKRNECRY